MPLAGNLPGTAVSATRRLTSLFPVSGASCACPCSTTAETVPTVTVAFALSGGSVPNSEASARKSTGLLLSWPTATGGPLSPAETTGKTAVNWGSARSALARSPLSTGRSFHVTVLGVPASMKASFTSTLSAVLPGRIEIDVPVGEADAEAKNSMLPLTPAVLSANAHGSPGAGLYG